MAGRFIKLYDKMLNWEWFRYPNTVHLFIYLLLKANYKDIEYHGMVIRRGQILTSIPRISTDTGLSIQQTKTALMHLRSTGEVTDEATTQNRIITIVKYDDYQTSTDKSSNDQLTINRRSNRQSTGAPTTSIEYIELQNDRNIEKEEHPTGVRRNAQRFTPPTLEEVSEYCLERGNGINPQRFIDYYDARGWELKPGQKVKDWKACIRIWEGKDKTPATTFSQQVRKQSADNFEQRDYSAVPDEQMDQTAREMAEFKRREKEGWN